MADPIDLLRKRYPAVVELRPKVYLVMADAPACTVMCFHIERMIRDEALTPEEVWRARRYLFPYRGPQTRPKMVLVEYLGGGMYRAGQKLGLSGGVVGRVVMSERYIDRYLVRPTGR